MFLLLFEVVIYTFISFSQYLKKDWREIEMKPGSYLGKRRFDWIVQIDWIVSKSNRFSRIININFNWSTDNFLTNERKIYPYPTTRGEKTENGGDQKRVSPSRCMRGDAVLANCALASQRLHLQLCSCLQIAVYVCVPGYPRTTCTRWNETWLCVCACAPISFHNGAVTQNGDGRNKRRTNRHRPRNYP